MCLIFVILTPGIHGNHAVLQGKCCALNNSPAVPHCTKHPAKWKTRFYIPHKSRATKISGGKSRGQKDKIQRQRKSFHP
uniref:Secreted protein n=1 Tax=Anguilla anguilla TaxID=7936 RepID=A0A0E9T8U7_ANGAN